MLITKHFLSIIIKFQMDIIHRDKSFYNSLIRQRFPRKKLNFKIQKSIFREKQSGQGTNFSTHKAIFKSV